jgi:hypothetical protein
MKIPAYSEFMPAPQMRDARIFAGKTGWNITEYEEALELQPGLRAIGSQLVAVLSRLGRGERAHGIEGKKLEGNPCWPDALREHGAPKHERYVLLLPLALSRTQDDKGRIRWTLFGGGERFPDISDELKERLLFEVYGKSVPNHLFTFTPFAELPTKTQEAYIRGDLHILPFPGSLLFFHAPGYAKLKNELANAMQIPLLYSIERNEDPRGIRVPQSGWMRERETAQTMHGPVRDVVKRTNRWTRVYRHEDELSVLTLTQKVSHTLFSTAPEDLGLYGKPMARNSQIWTDDYRLLLDGPRAGREELIAAVRVVDEGGHFGYRFFYPPMQVGRDQVYWHRPLVAWDNGFLDDAPLGHMSAGSKELTPKLLDRPVHRRLLDQLHGHPKTLSNARKIVDTCELLDDGPLDRTFARALISANKDESLEDWLKRKELTEVIAPFLSGAPPPPAGAPGPTFKHTATHQFETRYWKTIAHLAHGTYINKNNADVVLDKATQKRLKHKTRDLDRLAGYLLKYYERQNVVAGFLPFQWETDFNFSWSEGWISGDERNVIAVIPGKSRKRAVIMADHYDTAYMENVFGHSGKGARIAAPGADDNHSGTAALMLAAPIFLEMSRAGKLEHDIWLVHLTGEEFPADCLGARNLCQQIVEKTLRVHRYGAKPIDLSKAEIAGVFVLDMVAHNNRHARDIFQICPGQGRNAMLLARIAHEANVAWNASVEEWNARGPRRTARRAKRSADPRIVPPLARHLQLHGDVRPPSDAHSTLYNTDGQIFSDTGIPAVLFMENYDINRHGYHDSHDTMENIDLDYGAALVSIAIEAVARAARR